MEPNNAKIQAEANDETKRKIVNLMRRISKRSFLREIINAETGEVRDTPENVTVLLKVLKNTPEFKWRERRIAAIALGMVKDEQAEQVVVILGNVLTGTEKRPSMRWGQRIIKAKIIFWVWLLFWIAAWCAIMAYYNDRIPWFIARLWYTCYLLVMASPAVFIFSPLWDTRRNNKTRAEVLNTLARLEIPESIGALATVAKKTGRGSDQARQALLQIIPKLMPQHYGQMPPDTTPQLCGLLSSMEYTPVVEPYRLALIQNVLYALEMVGDGRAVETLKRCMGWIKNEKLKKRVAEVGLILVARREQEKNSNILLRGSDAPPPKSAELLRAASYSVTAEPEQLLRATHGPNDKANGQD